MYEEVTKFRDRSQRETDLLAKIDLTISATRQTICLKILH